MVGKENLCAMLCLLHCEKRVQMIICTNGYFETSVSMWDQSSVCALTVRYSWAKQT